MKKLSGIFLAIGLSISGLQPAVAEDAYVGELTERPMNSALFLIQEDGSDRILSTLGGHIRQENQPSTKSFACESVEDPKCVESHMDSWALLPPCSLPSQENCIVSLEVARGDSDFEKADFNRLVKTKTFPAVPELNFVEASAVSLWSVAGLEGGAPAGNYAVAVSLRQGQRSPGAIFESDGFIASVRPYREVLDSKYQGPYQLTVEGDPVLGLREESFAQGGAGNDECAWNEDGACGVLQDFPDGVKLKLSVRLPSHIGGWFRGRIKDPTVSVKPFSPTSNEISVAAEPVTVPRLAYLVPNVANLTAAERSLVRGFAGSWENFKTWAAAGDEFGFEYIRALKRSVKDTAAGTNSFWNFASSNSSSQGSQCLAETSSVLGIVTTNAMVYDGGVPKFRNGFLDYRVSGLHLQPDGKSPVLGTYDLVMRSDIARCLYGFRNAPVSATVSITGDGDTNIATTVVSERDGWLKLAAYGFTFSEKEIQVKLTQPQIRTLSNFSGRVTSLSTKQKAQIRAAVTKGAGNPKFICTGIRFVSQPTRDNIIVRARAKAACEYAKSLNPKLSTFFQTKTTQARSYNGRVLVVSK